MKVLKSMCVLVFLILSFNCIVSAAGVPDPGQKGPYKVGHTEFVVTDASRSNRPVAIYVWYPVDADAVNESTPGAIYDLDPFFDVLPNVTSADFENYGLERAYQEPPPSSDAPFPLVMFSPGWGCGAWDYAYIGTRLASHGFVVAALFHYADWYWPWEPFDEAAVTAFNRPRDVSFALTQLLARNQTPGDLLRNGINPDKVAASGHSFGGYATMALVAGDDEVCDAFQDPSWGAPPPAYTCVPTPPDPRIKVIVPLDGSNQCLHFAELARNTKPTMGMGQEWSTLIAQGYEPPWESWQARQHAAFAGRPAYRVDLSRANHLTFLNWGEMLPLYLGKEELRSIFDTDYPGLTDLLQWFYDTYVTGWIPSSEAHRLVTQYMVAFLKTNPEGVSGYQQMLTPGWGLTNEPDIEFFVTEKRNARSIDEDWPSDFVYFMHQPGSAQARGPKDPATMLPVRHLRSGR